MVSRQLLTPAPLVACVADGPAPPHPSPPPLPPPPYYQHAENCVPIPTPQFFGVDIDELSREQADGTTVAYRSACVFAKKIVEKRRKIKSCFERVGSPSPPPPPPAGGVESAQYAVEQEENRRVNGDSSIYANGAPDEAQMLADEIRGGVAETRALIAQLGNANPVLRELLSQSINEMESSIVRVSDGSVDPSEYYGRRLMQRQNEYASYMTDVLVEHPIMRKYGKDGLPGIDSSGCQALCEGVSVSPNQTDASECRAFAFKRRDPRSGTDFTGRCFLLQTAGTCKVRNANLLFRALYLSLTHIAVFPWTGRGLCLRALHAADRVGKYLSRCRVGVRCPVMHTTPRIPNRHENFDPRRFGCHRRPDADASSPWIWWAADAQVSNSHHFLQFCTHSNDILCVFTEPCSRQAFSSRWHVERYAFYHTLTPLSNPRALARGPTRLARWDVFFFLAVGRLLHFFNWLGPIHRGEEFVHWWKLTRLDQLLGALGDADDGFGDVGVVLRVF